MSNQIQFVETPFEEGQTKTAVRAGLREEYPGFRVVAIVKDEENSRWVSHLVAQAERTHHRLAEEEEGGKPPFPLKGLGPDDESEDKDSDEEASDDDTNTDDDELKDDEKPADDDKADVKSELGALLKAFKALLPALEKVVGPMPDEVEDAAEAPLPGPEDIGPVPGGGENAGPPGPPGLPPGGPPKAPGGRPPRRPGAPGGGRGRGPAPVGVPTFTHNQGGDFEPLKSQILHHPANITEDEARAKLARDFPQYNISDFKRVGSQYKAVLDLKE